MAGSRGIAKRRIVSRALKRAPFEITEVVSGACKKGVDQLGEGWAKRKGIPVKRFPADWNQYGRRAGPLRNREMARYADALIAIWDGKSRGTRSMIDEALREGLEVYVCITA